MSSTTQTGRISRLEGETRREQEIVTRLHKVAGQVTGVAGMCQQRRYCVDILDQLAAVTAAVDAVALMLLEDHVNHCVRAAVEDGAAEHHMSELAAAIRRYVKSR